MFSQPTDGERVKLRSGRDREEPGLKIAIPESDATSLLMLTVSHRIPIESCPLSANLPDFV